MFQPPSNSIEIQTKPEMFFESVVHILYFILWGTVWTMKYGKVTKLARSLLDKSILHAYSSQPPATGQI